MYARSVPKPAHWVLKSFAQLGASGLGGALRAPLGPVAAPLASSLRAPSRPHPPRDGGFALCTGLRLRMCFSCTTRRRKLRAEAAASTYAGGRPGSECAARNERSNERGRGAAGSPEPDALYYTNLNKWRGDRYLVGRRCALPGRSFDARTWFGGHRGLGCRSLFGW